MLAPVNNKQFSATHLLCAYFNTDYTSPDFVGISLVKPRQIILQPFWQWHQSDIHFPSQHLGKYFKNVL